MLAQAGVSARPVGRHSAPFQAPRAAGSKRLTSTRLRTAASADGGGDEAEGPPPAGAGLGGGRAHAAGVPLPITLSSKAVEMSASGEQEEVTRAEVGDKAAISWAEAYRSQQQQQEAQASSSGDSSKGSGDHATAGSFILPLMTLSKCKLPTESVPLQIFEPRYRLMFKLVNQSVSRRFGVVLADKNTGMMESVGALCELTHFITVPERRRLFVNARVVGRFKTSQVLADKPFVAVLATEHADAAPQGLAEQLQLGAQEMRVWQTMQEVRRLASKLFAGSSQLGNEIFSLEVRRWCPDAAVRAELPTVAGADPTLMRMVQLAGLLGDEQTMGERTTEYLCSDALRAVSEDERRERFSFALARTLDLGPERLQQLLYSQSTAERLHAAEELILEGRAYLAARSTLQDTF